MKTFWDPEARDELRTRIRRVRPDSRASWGRMSAPEMLAHCADAVRMGLGSLPVKPKKLPVRFWPLKQLFIFVLPMAKGLPTAPELVSRSAVDWDEEVASVLRLMDEFAARDGTSAFPEHPAFGTLTPRAWGVLGYRHFDHHLRQFGV